MQYLLDRTGFPMIKISTLKIAVHLLPVAKVQYERFIADRNEYGDEWYEKILSINPRASISGNTMNKYEGIFISGLLPSECQAFSHWLGDGFTLPTIQEWRGTYEFLGKKSIPKRISLRYRDTPVQEILEKMIEQYHPKTLRDLSLMNRGFVEWVEDEGRSSGLGSPRPDFYHNLWDPKYDTYKPQDTSKRQYFSGFRSIQRLAKSNN